MAQITFSCMGRFTLNVDRETFNNEVLPWVIATFGNRRGKKRDWEIEQQEYLSDHEKERIKQTGPLGNSRKWNLLHQPYFCRVLFKHNRDAIAFLVKWGDYCTTDSSLSYAYTARKAPKRMETVEGEWAKVAHAVRWMHRNVRPHAWRLQGSFRKPSAWGGLLEPPKWQFYLLDDDAQIAFLMVRPA